MEGTYIKIRTSTFLHEKLCILRVGGILDVISAGQFENALNSVLKEGLFKIIVDFTELEYISSAGWGVLIGKIKEVREKNGDIKLAAMQARVAEVFELLELNLIMQAFDSVEEAKKEFEHPKAPAVATEAESTDIETEEAPLEYKASSELELNQKRRESKVEAEPLQEVITADETVATELHYKYLHEILKIVRNYPQWGPTLIMRELNSAPYGFIKLSPSSIYRRLRKMNLNTKEKRVKFCDIRQPGMIR